MRHPTPDPTFITTPNMGEPVDVETFKARGPRVQRMRTWGGFMVYRRTGVCIVCGRPTFEEETGQSDPRGPMGDYANHGLTAKDDAGDMVGPDVNLCSLCGSEEVGYKAGVRMARITVWTYPDDPECE